MEADEKDYYHSMTAINASNYFYYLLKFGGGGGGGGVGKLEYLGGSFPLPSPVDRTLCT